jgi:lipopolysaccharide transport system ATP-binding protein
MPDHVIICENLSKRYTIRHQSDRYSTLRDTLSRKARSLFFPGEAAADDSREDFWALRDVSFAIERGDVVGIIGRNGAGKSTLLKILSRITEPTTGRIRLRGRVASLLEVGTGFHPELTGRENVFLNGAILGMTKAEIRSKFDEIVAFAEVEKFLDTPVKHYSSGMYVRLAFAVAAHLEPEILIVDEVLAVGDAAFQKKCLGKIRNVATTGRTVLFVSHNMQAVTAMCSRALLLAQGRCMASGSTGDVIGSYLSSSKSDRKLLAEYEPKDPDINLLRIHAYQPNSIDTPFITSLPTRIALTVQVNGVPGEDLICGLTALDANDCPVFSTYANEFATELPCERLHGTYTFTCVVPAHFFNEGLITASIDVGIAKKRAVTTSQHSVGLQFTNPNGLGSRFGLGTSWRKGPLLPLIPWDFDQLSTVSSHKDSNADRS